MFETAMTPAADETGGKRLHSFRQEAHIPTGIPLCKGGPSPWKNGEKTSEGPLRCHGASPQTKPGSGQTVFPHPPAFRNSPAQPPGYPDVRLARRHLGHFAEFQFDPLIRQMEETVVMRDNNDAFALLFEFRKKDRVKILPEFRIRIF